MYALFSSPHSIVESNQISLFTMITMVTEFPYMYIINVKLQHHKITAG